MARVRPKIVCAKEVFDKSAETYDRSRKQLVPCFDDIYGTVLNLIPYDPKNEFTVLDLGAGTGLLSFLVADAFPKANLTLVDVSQDMLEKARERFISGPDRFKYIVADYSEEELPGEFNVIISALSIHHISDSRKERLFQRIYEALSNNGVFINADQVLGATPEIEERYRMQWLNEVRTRRVSETDLSAALERMKADRSATLDHQLRWLRMAGFRAVNCWYKNYSFTVYSGSKTHTIEDPI